MATVPLLLAGALFVSTPPTLVNSESAPALPDDIDAWLAASEARAAEQFPLIPGTDKRIVWRRHGVRSRYVVIALHGFSATRQETAPLAERVAEALDANLFETRLTGHGRAQHALEDVHAEDWLADAAEALAIGTRLGDRCIVIGTSTGATLALAMSRHPLARSVSDIVLISPNFEPSDAAAAWLTRPGGPLIARAVAGETRTWTAHNAAQARYWSTSYPTAAVIEVMRLVDYVNASLPLELDQKLLVLLSPDDQVVSPQATRAAFERIDAPYKRLVEVDDAPDPSHHVLAGDILAPQVTPAIAQSIVDFVRNPG